MKSNGLNALNSPRGLYRRSGIGKTFVPPSLTLPRRSTNKLSPYLYHEQPHRLKSRRARVVGQLVAQTAVFAVCGFGDCGEAGSAELFCNSVGFGFGNCYWRTH